MRSFHFLAGRHIVVSCASLVAASQALATPPSIWNEGSTTRLSIRLDPTRYNGSAEVSLFTEDGGSVMRETVEISANGRGATSATGGQIVLRNIYNSGEEARNTVLLKSSDVSQGGVLELNTPAGDASIRLAASATSALNTAHLELRSNLSRVYVTPSRAQLYDLAGDVSINLEASSGTITTKVLTITGGSDLSEGFGVSSDAGQIVQPGMVVSIDPANPGELALSTEPNDRKVAGIISGANGINPGLVMGQQGTIADGKHPVALTGRVWCYVDADAGGAVTPGDLLTTSATPGHAAKVVDHGAAQGAIIGKAMSSLDHGKGLVLVLVNLQ